MSQIQEISTLPAGFTGTSATAQLQIDRAARFLYASNRGADNIAVFSIDPAQGTLTLVEHVSTQGKTPRDFSLDPTGRYLFAANQNSDTIVLFRVDPATGRLRVSLGPEALGARRSLFILARRRTDAAVVCCYVEDA